MNKQLKSIPRFATEAEERVFWETHDSTEFVDWSLARSKVLPNLKPTTQTISLSLEVGLLTLLVDPTAPPGAVAFLDGDPLGPLPLIRRKVPAGEHELVVRWGEQGGTFRETVNVPRLPADPLQKTVAPGG